MTSANTLGSGVALGLGQGGAGQGVVLLGHDQVGQGVVGLLGQVVEDRDLAEQLVGLAALDQGGQAGRVAGDVDAAGPVAEDAAQPLHPLGGVGQGGGGRDPAGVGVEALLLGLGELVLGQVQGLIGPVEGGGELLGVGLGVGQGRLDLLELAGDVGPLLGAGQLGQ